MQQTFGMFGAMDGLPDPDREPQFYEGVPARRLAAWVVDFLLVLLIGVPIALVFGLATFGLGFALFPMVIATVGFLYRTATIADRSATLGMRFMGIELRRSDGSRFDLVTAFLHTAIYTVAISFVFVQLASCVAILLTRYGQGLPDIILRTTAINRPAD